MYYTLWLIYGVITKLVSLKLVRTEKSLDIHRSIAGKVGVIHGSEAGPDAARHVLQGSNP